MNLRMLPAALLLSASGLTAQWLPVQFDSIVYPALATQARIEGIVTLRLVLGDDGSVTRVVELSGNQLLIDSARENALTWKFVQACSDRVLNKEVTFTYVFKLKGQTAERPRTRFRYEQPYTLTIVSDAQHWNPVLSK